MKKQNKFNPPKRRHDRYFDKASGSRDTEQDSSSARGTKIAKTNAKVSERYDEHQSSTLLGDTKSTQSGDLVGGENNEDYEDEGRR
jgi:uncharacterized protein with WD repeat